MKADKNVFPYQLDEGNGNVIVYTGLKVRDYIAIQAMVGLIAQGSGLLEPLDETAKTAYMMADAMIKRSERHE